MFDCRLSITYQKYREIITQYLLLIIHYKQTRPLPFKIVDGSFDLVESARILSGFDYMTTCLITPID